MASDLKLVKKVLKGNKVAFGKLIELYQDQILYLLYDYLGNYEDAKDAAQDVFVKAYENLKQFNQNAEFKTWLYRIAVNTGIDYLRKRKSMFDLQYKIKTDNPDIFTLKSENILWDDRFRDTLNTLSENQYSAVVLKYFHEKSTVEISNILECDISTVRVHLHRGVEKLKLAYKKKE